MRTKKEFRIVIDGKTQNTFYRLETAENIITHDLEKKLGRGIDQIEIINGKGEGIRYLSIAR